MTTNDDDVDDDVIATFYFLKYNQQTNKQNKLQHTTFIIRSSKKKIFHIFTTERYTSARVTFIGQGKIESIIVNINMNTKQWGLSINRYENSLTLFSFIFFFFNEWMNEMQFCFCFCIDCSLFVYRCLFRFSIENETKHFLIEASKITKMQMLFSHQFQFG